MASAEAQSNRTTETQRDRYGHITGTAVTTTKSDGTSETVYKDAYGHITAQCHLAALERHFGDDLQGPVWPHDGLQFDQDGWHKGEDDV